jgi:hypothetical protein
MKTRIYFARFCVWQFARWATISARRLSPRRTVEAAAAKLLIGCWSSRPGVVVHNTTRTAGADDIDKRATRPPEWNQPPVELVQNMPTSS